MRQDSQSKKENIDPQTVQAIKEEVLADLKARREQEENSQRKNENRPKKDWDREKFQEYHCKNNLRDELQRELKAVLDMESRLSRVKNPETQRLVRELLEEAHRKGLSTADLVQSLNDSRITFRDRLSALFLDPNNRFPLGVGAAVVALLLFPSTRGNLRPLARKAIEEVMSLSEKTQTVIAQAQEGLNDIVAEAQFSRIEDSVQQSIDNQTLKE